MSLLDTAPLDRTNFDRAAADSHIVTPRRSRPTRPTTADLLRGLRATLPPDGAADLAHVGIALHHFTDLMPAESGASTIELHRATTLLTKQVRSTIGAAADFDLVRGLVTDPDRIATPDGRTATEFCGNGWGFVRDRADERATAGIAGSTTFGDACVLQLAALHASCSDRPWWGTAGWRRVVDSWLHDHHCTASVRTALVQAPESVDSDILGSLLDG